MFRRFIHSIYVLPILCLFLTASCEKEEDFRVDGGGNSSVLNVNSKVTILQEHTKGSGVPIVITADGYQEADIANGTFRKMTVKAMASLFCEEPMASLREYFDVYEATAISVESGITDKERNTVFGTYIPDSKQTLINGKDTTAHLYAVNAFYQTNGKDITKAYQRANDCVTIVLLNSSQYAGTTSLRFLNNNIKDSIPSGFSVAYLPDKAEKIVTTYYTDKNGNIIKTEKVRTDMLNTLVQHEAVGHGLAKLGDEYDYENNGTPPFSLQDNFRKTQGIGGYMNVSMESKVSQSPWASFADDARYAEDKLSCYAGAYTYSTLFYRPTTSSIMRSATTGFNVPSRCAIYKRTMKIANGSTWKFNYEDFVAFDEKNRTKASNAKGETPATYATTTTGAWLASPRVILE